MVEIQEDPQRMGLQRQSRKQDFSQAGGGFFPQVFNLFIQFLKKKLILTLHCKKRAKMPKIKLFYCSSYWHLFINNVLNNVITFVI